MKAIRFALWCLSIVYVVALVPAAGASEPTVAPPTDLELLEQMVARALDSALAGAPVRQGDEIYIRPLNTHEIGWLIEDRIASTLTARGALVYLRAAPSDSARGHAASRADTSRAGGGAGSTGTPEMQPRGCGTVLEFRVVECGVTHPRRWRRSLLGSAMVERAARVLVFLRLVRLPDREVLWTRSARSSGGDVIPEALLAELSNLGVGRTGRKPGGRGVGRVIEPIVVSGIVVGLVFLFYSSRT